MVRLNSPMPLVLMRAAADDADICVCTDEPSWNWRCCLAYIWSEALLLPAVSGFTTFPTLRSVLDLAPD